MSKEEMTGYSLSRHWFDFCFENPEKIRPIHTAIYMFALEHWNRLGQKKKFGFPSQMTMDAIGVKSYNTYIPAFKDLVDWGFFDLIEKSKNQYSSNIIALSNIDKALDKALDKAFVKHSTKQVQSNQQSTCSIDKQYNNEQENKEQGTTREENFLSLLENVETHEEAFEIWNKYRKKKGKHANLYEKEVLIKKEWKEMSPKEVAEAILYTVKNGWVTLQYPEEDQKPENEPVPQYLTRRL